MPTLNTLADFTSSDLMIPSLVKRHPAAAIQDICSILHRQGCVYDPLCFLNAVMSRELLCSTATDQGWALPHARLPGIAHLSFAVARCAPPVNWFGSAATTVRLVFLFAVPATEAAGYLTLVSSLAKLSQDPARLESLHRAPDAQGMFEVLKQIPLRTTRSNSGMEAKRGSSNPSFSSK